MKVAVLLLKLTVEELTLALAETISKTRLGIIYVTSVPLLFLNTIEIVLLVPTKTLLILLSIVATNQLVIFCTP